MRILFLLISFPLLSFSQQPIDAEQFFALGLSQQEASRNDNIEKVLFPWIEEYEFRTETRDLDFQSQEYTFRISPSTLKKREAQKALYKHFANIPDFEYQKTYCDRLLAVHADWLSLSIINDNLNLLEELNDVLNDRQTIYEKMAGAYDFDFQKLVKLLTDKSDIAIIINELQLEQDFICGRYGIADPEFDFRDFVAVESIFIVLNNGEKEAAILSNPETAYEKELITKELALETAEKRQFFDFAQFRYVGPHSDLLRERLSIGLGLRIPSSGNRKLKIRELQLEQKKIERDEERAIEERQQELENLRRKLIMDIRAYDFYQSTMAGERTQLENMGIQAAKKEGFNPLLLLDIEARYITTKLKGLKKREDILIGYLEYLERSGILCRQPFVNYLGE